MLAISLKYIHSTHLVMIRCQLKENYGHHISRHIGAMFPPIQFLLIIMWAQWTEPLGKKFLTKKSYYSNTLQILSSQ